MTNKTVKGTCPNVTSLSARILDIVRREPDRKFVVLDFIQLTKAKPDAVRQALHRLISKNKGDIEIMKIDRGFYQFNPMGERPDLMALMRYGYWRVENVRFITKGARGDLMSQQDTKEITLDPNRSIANPLPGFPWNLPSGQQVHWSIYYNGTQEIRLSANKKAPFSPDHALTLLQILEQKGFGGPEWECTSMEVNVEGRNWTIPGSFNVKLIQGLLIKVYQHGPSVRIELADRRSCTTKEALTVIHAVANGFDGAEALNLVKEIEPRIRRCEKRLGLSLFKRASDGYKK
jgi:hypothetical protein